MANFNGTDSEAILMDAGVQPTSYTLIAWARQDVVRYQAIVYRSTADPASASHSLKFIASGLAESSIYDGGTKIVQMATTSANAWTCLAGTAVNGGQLRGYQDGQEWGTPVTIGTLWASGDRWRFSRAGGYGGSWFDGDIGPVAFWRNVELTAEQIQTITLGGPQALDDFPIRPTWVLPFYGDAPEHEVAGFGVNATLVNVVAGDSAPPILKSIEQVGQRVSQWDGELIIGGPSGPHRVTMFDGELIVGGVNPSGAHSGHKISQFDAELLLNPFVPNRVSQFDAELIVIPRVSTYVRAKVMTAWIRLDLIPVSAVLRDENTGQLIGTVVHQASSRPLAHRSDYYDGHKWKEVVNFGDVERALTDYSGSPEVSTFTIEVEDKRGFWRSLLANSDTVFMTGADITYYLLSEQQTMELGPARIAFRGQLENPQLVKGRRFRVNAQSRLGTAYGPLNMEGSVLKRAYNAVKNGGDFADGTFPPSSAGLAVRFLWGEKSDKGKLDPITGLSVEKGAMALVNCGRMLAKVVPPAPTWNGANWRGSFFTNDPPGGWHMGYGDMPTPKPPPVDTMNVAFIAGGTINRGEAPYNDFYGIVWAVDASGREGDPKPFDANMVPATRITADNQKMRVSWTFGGTNPTYWRCGFAHRYYGPRFQQVLQVPGTARFADFTHHQYSTVMGAGNNAGQKTPGATAGYFNRGEYRVLAMVEAGRTEASWPWVQHTTEPYARPAHISWNQVEGALFYEVYKAWVPHQYFGVRERFIVPADQIDSDGFAYFDDFWVPGESVTSIPPTTPAGDSSYYFWGFTGIMSKISEVYGSNLPPEPPEGEDKAEEIYAQVPTSLIGTDFASDKDILLGPNLDGYTLTINNRLYRGIMARGPLHVAAEAGSFPFRVNGCGVPEDGVIGNPIIDQAALVYQSVFTQLLGNNGKGYESGGLLTIPNFPSSPDIPMINSLSFFTVQNLTKVYVGGLGYIACVDLDSFDTTWSSFIQQMWTDFFFDYGENHHGQIMISMLDDTLSPGVGELFRQKTHFITCDQPGTVDEGLIRNYIEFEYDEVDGVFLSGVKVLKNEVSIDKVGERVEHIQKRYTRDEKTATDSAGRFLADRAVGPMYPAVTLKQRKALQIELGQQVRLQHEDFVVPEIAVYVRRWRYSYEDASVSIVGRDRRGTYAVTASPDDTTGSSSGDATEEEKAVYAFATFDSGLLPDGSIGSRAR